MRAMPKIFNNKKQKELRQFLRGQMPTAELILWSYIRGRQVLDFKFRRQESIGRYVVDFYCPRAKLVLEIDGDSHFEKGAKEYDEDRQEQIESLGLKILRFTNTEIYKNIESVVERIEETLQGLQPPLAPPLKGGESV